jgi:signal transduction histidine kinase
LTTIFGVITLILIRADSSSLRDQLFSSSKAFAALATKPIGDTYLTYQDSGTVVITQQVVGFTQLESTVSNVSVVDTEGKVRYSLHAGVSSIPPSQATSFQPIYIYNKQHSIQRILYPFIDDNGSHQFAMVYDISSAEVNSAVHKLELSIVAYTIFGLVGSVTITYLFINRLFIIPIRRLRDQAIIISSGYYKEQITVDRKDELGDLAQSVKQMADNLKDDINKLREVDKVKSEFMMIASHNLRTPLTIIDGYLDLAKSENLSSELSTILTNIETNSQRLKVFAEDLLIISSLEAGQTIFTLENTIVNDVLKPIADDFMEMSTDKKIEFTTKLEPELLEIRGSGIHLRNAIYNLLDNAFKFTPEGGKVELKLAQIGETVQIAISDNGAGIAPNEIDKLFTKFHRGTSTLEYNYDGSGIGLYLTKLIITEHRGTIDVRSELGKGSVFTVTLPMKDQDKPAKTAVQPLPKL